jgi:hypothetical protein
MYLSSFSQGTNMYNFKQAQCRSKQMELDNRPTIFPFSDFASPKSNATIFSKIHHQINQSCRA